MTAPALFTYRDVIDHLCNVFGGLAPEKEHTRAKGAVTQALRTFYAVNDWTYFVAHERIALSASYSTGTVAFDLTGGTYEYQLTLSDGVWPAWARYGHIEIDGVVYKVAERKSDTVVTLEPGFAPSADIAAGESYELFRSVYTLPDVLRVHEIHDESHWFRNSYVSPTEWLAMERRVGGAGRPYAWTLFGDRNLYGSYAIGLHRRPPAAETLDFICTRKPQRLKFTGYASGDYTGTVAASADGTAVVGSSTAFAAAQVGSVIRFSSSSSVPDGEEGLNEYQEQRIVSARADTTHLTVDTALTNEYSTSGYVISSPVDLPDTLYNAFLRRCEFEMALRVDPAKAGFFEAAYQAALREAMISDQMLATEPGGSDWWSHESWSFTFNDVTTAVHRAY
jgi:hypothetical protein